MVLTSLCEISREFPSPFVLESSSFWPVDDVSRLETVTGVGNDRPGFFGKVFGERDFERCSSTDGCGLLTDESGVGHVVATQSLWDFSSTAGTESRSGSVVGLEFKFGVSDRDSDSGLDFKTGSCE